MRRRQIASIGALIVLALTAGCVGALGQTDGPAVDDANRTITVTATGEVTAAADQAVVRVSVVARGDSAEAARQRLSANVTALREGLSAANVSDDQIQTAGYGIREERPRPERVTGEGPDPTYVARQSFEITVPDTDRVGAVIDAAVTSGATRVEGVQFTLSESAQKTVKQEALREAMDAARRNAETLAATENLTVGETIQITNTNVRPVPAAAGVAASPDSGGGTVIDGGPVTVTATVEVVYAANES